MSIELDAYELDLLMETLSFRLENDDQLILNLRLKEELEDLLLLIEDQYV